MKLIKQKVRVLFFKNEITGYDHLYDLSANYLWHANQQGFEAGNSYKYLQVTNF